MGESESQLTTNHVPQLAYPTSSTVGEEAGDESVAVVGTNNFRLFKYLRYKLQTGLLTEGQQEENMSLINDYFNTLEGIQSPSEADLRDTKICKVLKCILNQDNILEGEFRIKERAACLYNEWNPGLKTCELDDCQAAKSKTESNAEPVEKKLPLLSESQDLTQATNDATNDATNGLHPSQDLQRSVPKKRKHSSLGNLDIPVSIRSSHKSKREASTRRTRRKTTAVQYVAEESLLISDSLMAIKDMVQENAEMMASLQKQAAKLNDLEQRFSGWDANYQETTREWERS